MASVKAQPVTSLPAMQETRIQCLSQEDPLEKEMATHSSIVAWRIPWAEEPGRLQSIGLQRVGHEGLSAELLQSNSAKHMLFLHPHALSQVQGRK